ncbi:MAG: neutral zinc metallopeptidase [Chloroflexota bacterium]|nr:neutral zinc metallopeptidase [Chloroflexota bacterium]
MAFVIAHEWAHHVQTGVGIERVQDTPEQWNELYSIELELMADCLSGAWTLDADTRGLLETDDVDEAINFTVQYLGDPPGTDEYDPQAHGTADQRVQSFLNGYENGFLGCNQTI